MTSVLRALSKCGGNGAWGGSAAEGPAVIARARRRVELPCQPGAEQRSGGRQANGTWKHARADVVARQQARRGIDAVYHGGRFEPAAHGRAAVQGHEYPEPQAEVAGADHAGKETRRALGPGTAGHCAAHQLRRQERHHADGDPPARQDDRQVPSIHQPDRTRTAVGRYKTGSFLAATAHNAAILPRHGQWPESATYC
jgi:hypothetical protein